MRFLQIEWHNHERARNAWDIERAEMKAKIAKQEGELRHSKRLNEQLERQTRMLELALKNERNKNKDKTASDKPTPTSPSKASKSSADAGGRNAANAKSTSGMPSHFNELEHRL